MFSVSRAMGSGHAVGYFSREDAAAAAAPELRFGGNGNGFAWYGRYARVAAPGA